MASATTNLTLSFERTWKTAVYIEGKWTMTYQKDGKTITVTSTLLIAATELGDVAAAQGLPYRLGMDARDEIGESYAPAEANNIIQDLTYVTTLQDYGKGTDKTIPKLSLIHIGRCRRYAMSSYRWSPDPSIQKNNDYS